MKSMVRSLDRRGRELPLVLHDAAVWATRIRKKGSRQCVIMLSDAGLMDAEKLWSYFAHGFFSRRPAPLTSTRQKLRQHDIVTVV